MPYMTVGKENSDAIELYDKDWGSGQPVVFSHGWPLSVDAWEDQMLFLAAHGYRCSAHDRRGHGRWSQPWHGNHYVALGSPQDVGRNQSLSGENRRRPVYLLPEKPVT